MQFYRVGHLIATLAAAALLGACGAEETQTTKPSAAPAADVAAQTAAAAAREATKGMVSGVTNPAKPGAPVSMWFDIKDRPAVGAPLSIDIALVPQAATDHMRMTFIATDGLTVKAATTPPEYRNVQAGGVYRHTLTVTPREEGAYYVGAIVLMEAENGPEARTFSIPVIVGTPADIASDKPAPPADATGQPIESMPST